MFFSESSCLREMLYSSSLPASPRSRSGIAIRRISVIVTSVSLTFSKQWVICQFEIMLLIILRFSAFYAVHFWQDCFWSSRPRDDVDISQGKWELHKCVHKEGITLLLQGHGPWKNLRLRKYLRLILDLGHRRDKKMLQAPTLSFIVHDLNDCSSENL